MPDAPATLSIRGLGEEIASLSHLPWSTPLESWPEDPSLALQRGISRHVVRLVRALPSEELLADSTSDLEIYAVKETIPEIAEREYQILRELSHRGAPSVTPIAVVEGRSDESGESLPAALVTRFLPFSSPYRVILSGALGGKVTGGEIENMASALALLLVRLHLLGFWWGDCSLSNTLFRRDAESYAAYLVDAETGEFHQTLSKGQREHDLEIAHFNVAAELEDISLSDVIYPGLDPIRASDAVIRRYRRLWSAITEPRSLDVSDRHAVERAMRAVQDLGFAVAEVEVTFDGSGHQLKFTPKVVAPDYHKEKVHSLMGIEVEEFQAKRLLASFDRYYTRSEEPRPPKEEVAERWLEEVFRHVVEQVPPSLRGRVEDAQLFHEVLEHRWYLGERAGRDVGLDFATSDYIAAILPSRMDSGTLGGESQVTSIE
jgi:hypothetical protein